MLNLAIGQGRYFFHEFGIIFDILVVVVLEIGLSRLLLLKKGFFRQNSVRRRYIESICSLFMQIEHVFRVTDLFRVVQAASVVVPEPVIAVYALKGVAERIQTRFFHKNVVIHSFNLFCELK